MVSLKSEVSSTTVFSFHPLSQAVNPSYIYPVPMNKRTTANVNLNSLNKVPISPYLKGKVCHISIRIMMKVKEVRTIWIGYISNFVQETRN